MLNFFKKLNDILNVLLKKYSFKFFAHCNLKVAYYSDLKLIS